MTQAESRDVAVVIVGRNAREYVRECLESLAAAMWRDVTRETVYVDNESTDGTVEMVAERFPYVRRIVNDANIGFCKAANQGARAADARHYMFINDDTVVLDDAIALLVEYMDAHPEVVTAGSRLLNTDGTEQWSGRRFPRIADAIVGRRSPLARLFPNARGLREYLCKDQLESGEPFDVDWVSAAGQIVRRDAFWRAGGYAEDYYYWHEAVFCDRLRAAGGRVVLHPLSRIVHHEGKGSGARPFKVQRFHILDFHRGAFRCYCEHHRLGRLHPMRWLAAAALTARAACLLGAAGVASLRVRR